MTGPITVHLWAASSAPDTDFVVKLMDVRPDGFVQELCYGIVRARYRESYRQSVADRAREGVTSTRSRSTRRATCSGGGTASGWPCRAATSRTSTATTTRAGHDYFESTLATARQTVYHDRERPSRVVLPVIR